MKYLFLLLTFTFLAGCETTSPTLQTGANAEITFDGLHRVDGSYMQYAWLKPDLNLAAYTKIHVVNAGIEYREVKPASRSPSANARRSEFPLTEKKKARLESILREVFQEELRKSKYFTLASEPGPDVLTLTGGLLDVVSAIPPELKNKSVEWLKNWLLQFSVKKESTDITVRNKILTTNNVIKVLKNTEFNVENLHKFQAATRKLDKIRGEDIIKLDDRFTSMMDKK